jgi:hypothetical protein
MGNKYIKDFIHLINYTPLPTGERLHASEDLFQHIIGPVGSGKTTMCLAHMLLCGLQAAFTTNWLIVVPHKNFIRGIYILLERLVGEKNLRCLKKNVFCYAPYGVDAHAGQNFRVVVINKAEKLSSLYYPNLDGVLIDSADLFFRDVLEGIESLSILNVGLRGTPFSPTVLMTSNAPINNSACKFHQPPAIHIYQHSNGNKYFEVNKHAENLENLPEDFYLKRMNLLNLDDVALNFHLGNLYLECQK